LIRGLEKAKPPGERYRRLNQRLPYFLKRWLPAPQQDSTRISRQCLVWLLSRLGNDAKSAAPIMIWTAGNDEADSVRFGAIGYFNTGGGDNCLVNKLPADQKRALLPVLIRAMQDAGNNSLRHNTSILLKYFPEYRDELAPVLVKALQFLRHFGPVELLIGVSREAGTRLHQRCCLDGARRWTSRVSVIREATLTPEKNVSAATAQSALLRPSASASTPATTAPMA